MRWKCPECENFFNINIYAAPDYGDNTVVTSGIKTHIRCPDCDVVLCMEINTCAVSEREHRKFRNIRKNTPPGTKTIDLLYDNDEIVFQNKVFVITGTFKNKIPRDKMHLELIPK